MPVPCPCHNFQGHPLATMKVAILVLVNVLYTVAGLPKSIDKRLLLQINAPVQVGTIDDRHLDEASGLCASRVHSDILYSHNDHGGQNRLFAINSTNGNVVSVITINGANSNDWEDVACGKCYGHLNNFCIYIGDMGDGGPGSAQTVYRVVEPASLAPTLTINVDGTLKYSWDQVDVETLMVTPNADLYIISKVANADSKIGLLPKEAWSQSGHVPITQMAPLSGITTTHDDPMGGDISPDGQEILVKTLENIYHYSMNGGTDYISVLQGTPDIVPYKREPKGGCVAFSADGRSYFTLSEGVHQPLYRYDAALDAVIG